MEIESVPFDLRAVIEDVLSVFEGKLQQNQLEVSALIHDSVPPCLIGDPGKVKQVLVNIVGNAIKVMCCHQGPFFVVNYVSVNGAHLAILLLPRELLWMCMHPS
jgi:histidine kinase 2/3/4 (cytokinin receptor)